MAMKDRATNPVPRPGSSGLALVAILLAGGCLPASAQNLSLAARPAAPPTPTFSVRLQPAPPAPNRLATDVPADYHTNKLTSIVDSATHYVETPFVQQALVPLARFSGGRFELGGFDTLRPMENELLGPPSSGSLEVWSVATQAHPGIWVPEADQSYGLSLSVRLKKRDPQPGRQAQILRCLGWAVGRGCHLN